MLTPAARFRERVPGAARMAQPSSGVHVGAIPTISSPSSGHPVKIVATRGSSGSWRRLRRLHGTPRCGFARAFILCPCPVSLVRWDWVVAGPGLRFAQTRARFLRSCLLLGGEKRARVVPPAGRIGHSAEYQVRYGVVGGAMSAFRPASVAAVASVASVAAVAAVVSAFSAAAIRGADLDFDAV